VLAAGAGRGLLSLCAADSASVFAVDPAGKTVWRAALPDGAGDIVLRPGTAGARAALAGAGTAGLVAIADSGKARVIG